MTFTYPLEVLQSRMASGRQYIGIVDCFLQTWRVDGMRAFYKGYSASLLGIIPYTGSQFFLYEGGKNWKKRSLKRSKRELSIWEKFRQVCTSILLPNGYRTRKRLQVGSLHTESLSSLLPRGECCRNIFKNEGVSGFYRGMSLNEIASYAQSRNSICCLRSAQGSLWHQNSVAHNPATGIFRRKEPILTPTFCHLSIANMQMVVLSADEAVR